MTRRIIITIEIELDEPARSVQPGTSAERVVNAIKALVASGQIPSHTNIARHMKRKPGSVSPVLRNLLQRGVIYKGPRIGQSQPYYIVEEGGDRRGED